MSREYKNDGRDQIPIEHLTGNVYIGDQRSRKRPDKEAKWLRAFEKEIAGRLTTSLHNQILINLGKEIELDQVRRLWDIEVKSGQITDEIAPETEILEVFDRADIQGKLLILGKPGAGKTTTLLELARSLVEKALSDPTAPMPILLNLSSWKDPNQSIKEWTITQLSTQGISSKISARWLEDQKLLPLLDGLDEVRSDLQPACVKTINQFLSGAGKPEAIVVCSRREEYELYSEKLDLNGAIYLQELSDAQIETYLGKVDRLSLWEVLGADADLLELVRQPLLLSITLIAYRKELAERWQALQTTQARLEFLLDAYVERMLHRESSSQLYAGKKEPTPEQTRQWLVRLAKQLHRESETEFLIEKMQPTWLITCRQRWAYGLIVVLIFVLIFGLTFGLIVVLIFGLIFGLTFGLTFGCFEIIRLDNIKPVKSFKISMPCFVSRGFFRSFSVWLIIKSFSVWLIIRLIIGLIIGLTVGLIGGLMGGLTGGLVDGLMGGLMGGLTGGLRVDIEPCIFPNKGILNSRNNTILLVITFLVLAALIQTFLPQLLIHILDKKSILGILALTMIALTWSSFQEGGGRACIQHFVLRLILFLSHAIPWNYARFLNYATERMFLQRIGGRYRFIHKLLQEHFAKMEL